MRQMNLDYLLSHWSYRIHSFQWEQITTVINNEADLLEVLILIIHSCVEPQAHTREMTGGRQLSKEYPNLVFGQFFRKTAWN